MTREAKRLLEQALASPEFMTEVKAAVLASPLVKAKDEEIARLRAEVERLNGAIRDAVSVFDPSGPEPVTTGLLAFMQRNVKRDLDAALARAEALQRHADGQAEVLKAVVARAEAAEKRVNAFEGAAEYDAGRDTPASDEALLVWASILDKPHWALPEIQSLITDKETVERERDDARATWKIVSAEVARLREALRECQQGQDEKGDPCWCRIPSMIPYRGHDSGCEAARAALSGEGESRG